MRSPRIEIDIFEDLLDFILAQPRQYAETHKIPAPRGSPCIPRSAARSHCPRQVYSKTAAGEEGDQINTVDPDQRVRSHYALAVEEDRERTRIWILGVSFRQGWRLLLTTAF